MNIKFGIDSDDNDLHAVIVEEHDDGGVVELLPTGGRCYYNRQRLSKGKFDRTRCLKWKN